MWRIFSLNTWPFQLDQPHAKFVRVHFSFSLSLFLADLLNQNFCLIPPGGYSLRAYKPGSSAPRGANFFQLPVCERVGISVVEVYERVHSVVKTVISVCKKVKKG